jgi:hypothetical protein
MRSGRMSDIDELKSLIPDDWKDKEFYENYSNDKVLDLAGDYIICLENRLLEFSYCLKKIRYADCLNHHIVEGYINSIMSFDESDPLNNKLKDEE